jgi:uncharacterized protein YlxW (UPF0749 family)
VSNSTYELAKRDAENAKLLYQNEQHRTQELVTANKQIKAQVEALQVALEDAQKKFERVDRDWRETRDELMKLKIEREQQLARSRGRRGEGELAVPGPSADSEETKRRIKELVQRLQAVLNQF